ncbi:MAG: hypothetical protein IH933_15870 [Euryarchaeota archaeon]|jgi:hypothetical protein|nr:hypothetical protein [Euryarchaeota archaeon]
MTADLVDPETADHLVRTARTAIGDSLRSATYFTRDDYEQLYLRSDLEQDADLSTFIGTEWRGFRITKDAYQGSELGDYNYTIRVFDGGYLVRMTTDREGVLVTTDGITMQDFEALASAIGAVLR